MHSKGKEKNTLKKRNGKEERGKRENKIENREKMEEKPNAVRWREK